MRLSTFSRGSLALLTPRTLPRPSLCLRHRSPISLPLFSPFIRFLFTRRKSRRSPTHLLYLAESLSSTLSSSSLPITSQIDVVRQLTDVHLSLHQYEEANSLLWRLCDAQTRPTSPPSPTPEKDVLEAVGTMASIVHVMRTDGLEKERHTTALDDLVDRYTSLISTSPVPASTVDNPSLIHFLASIARCYVDLNLREKAIHLLRSQLTFDEGTSPRPIGEVSDGRGLRYATAYNFLGIAAYDPPVHQHTEECQHSPHHHSSSHDFSGYDYSESEGLWQRALDYCQPLISALSSPSSPASAGADLPPSAASSVFTPDSVPLHLLRCYAMTQDNRAQALYRANRTDEAFAIMNETLTQMASILPAHHPDVVRTRQQLILLLLPHHPTQAHHHSDLLLSLDRRDIDPLLNPTFDTLAQLFFQNKKFGYAAKLFQKCIDIREAVEGGSRERGEVEDLILASRYNDLAMCELRLKEYSQAEAHLRRSLALKEAVLGPNHHELAVSAHNLGTALTHLHRYPEAEEQLLRAWTMYEQRKEEAGELSEEHQRNHDMLFGILSGHLGQVYGLTERWTEAVERYQQAVERKQKVLGDHPAVTMDLSALAGVMLSAGAYDGALSAYEAVREMSERLYGEEHVSACVCWHWLSVAKWKAGKREEAVLHAKRAVALGEHLRVKNMETVQVGMMDVLRKNFAEQLRGLGKDMEADAQEHLLITKA